MIPNLNDGVSGLIPKLDDKVEEVSDRFIDIFKFISASIKRLIAYIGKDDKREIRNCAIMMLVSTLILTFVPLFVGSYIDRVIDDWFDGKPDNNYIVFMSIGIIVLILVWFMINRRATKRMIVLGMALTKRMRAELNDKILRLPIPYLDKHPAGNLTALLTHDIGYVFKLLSTDLIGAMVFLITTALITAMMLLTNIWMGLLFVILIPLSIGIAQWVGKRCKKDFVEEKRSVGLLNGLVLDTLSNHKLAKTYRLEDSLENKFGTINENHRRSFTNSRTASGLIEPTVMIITNLGYVLAAAMGAVLMINGMLSKGLFVAFIFYVRAVIKPMTASSSSINRIQSEMASLNRIMDILEEKEIEDADGHLDKESCRGELSFDNVTFSYDGRKNALSDVSYTISPGTSVAIIGPTGSGKSTMISLIQKFYSPNRGSITLDGKDISGISNRELMNVLGAIQQVPWFFNGTVMENICFGNDFPRDRVIETSAITGLDTFVKKMPYGYETIVGEGEHMLSSVEIKLIALTRVLLSDPKVLVLDEATTGLDPRTEMNIIGSIRKIMEGRTVVMTTHNVNLASKADIIIVMDNGKMVEMGSHDELMNKGGRYRDLYLLSS